MAAFFAWGNVANSFVVANGSILDYQNMPQEYEGKFKSNEWNAMTLQTFTTGPDGFHWAQTPLGQWSARAPNTLIPYLSTQLLSESGWGMGRGSCEFVAFAPDGVSWFARYSSKTCLWGPDSATLPSTWRAIIADLEANHPRKDECIDFVAFGAHDLLLIRFENGNSAMFLPEDPVLRGKISQSVVDEVEERLKAGWTFGNRTTLCHFDSNRWFIEWKRGTMAEFRYNMGMGEASASDVKRVSAVLQGVGNNPAAVADSQAAQMIAATASFNRALMLNRSLYWR